MSDSEWHFVTQGFRNSSHLHQDADFDPSQDFFSSQEIEGYATTTSTNNSREYDIDSVSPRRSPISKRKRQNISSIIDVSRESDTEDVVINVSSTQTELCLLNETELNFKTLPAEKCLSRTLISFEGDNRQPTTTVDSYSQTLCYGNTVDDKCSQTDAEFLLVDIKNLVFSLDNHVNLSRSLNPESQEFSQSSEHVFSLQSDYDIVTTEKIEKDCQTVISMK